MVLTCTAGADKWLLNFLITAWWFLMGLRLTPESLESIHAPMFWSSSIFQGSLHCTPDSFMLSWMSCALKHQCANLHGIFSVSRALPHLLKVSVQCPLVAGLPDSPFRCGRVPVAWCNNLVCIGEVQHALFGSFFFFLFTSLPCCDLFEAAKD